MAKTKDIEQPQQTMEDFLLAQLQEEVILKDGTQLKTEADTFKDLCNYLVEEKCVTDEQRTEFFAMIDRAVERSKYNWAVHELADQVDFVCEKVVLLADACGVTKHKEEDEED